MKYMLPEIKLPDDESNFIKWLDATRRITEIWREAVIALNANIPLSEEQKSIVELFASKCIRKDNP